MTKRILPILALLQQRRSTGQKWQFQTERTSDTRGIRRHVIPRMASERLPDDPTLRSEKVIEYALFDKAAIHREFGVESYFDAIPLGKIEENEFHFGLSEFPMIGKDVYLTALEDVKTIFESQSGGFDLQLGPLTTLREYEPVISIDHLFTHHMSILGNTGSGKSTTSRTLLHMIEQKIKKGELNPEHINFLTSMMNMEWKMQRIMK